MFCKWCGETVTSGDRQCRRCGKELPALSDCGGFYDLVNLGGQPSRPAPQQEVRVDLSGVQTDIRRASSMEKKRANRLWLLTLIGFGLTLILLFILLIQVGNLHSRIDRLEQTVEALHETQETEPEDQTDPTDSTEATDAQTDPTEDTAPDATESTSEAAESTDPIESDETNT